jgi:hypothetical protein
MIFNIIWVVGTVLVLPWPFVTFALFFTVRDIGEGKGIKFNTFMNYGRQTLKPAYIWGAINLVIFVALIGNLTFYGRFQAQWGGLIQILILAIIFFWSLIQLIALALYPRLVEPGFRLALRNAAVLLGRYPLPILALLAVISLLIVISLFFSALFILITFSVIAVFINGMVEALVSHELKRLDEQQQDG